MIIAIAVCNCCHGRYCDGVLDECRQLWPVAAAIASANSMVHRWALINFTAHLCSFKVHFRRFFFSTTFTSGSYGLDQLSKNILCMYIYHELMTAHIPAVSEGGMT